MSKTAKDFVQAARENDDLRLEIEKFGQDISALITFAKSKGYDFSETDFVATIRNAGYEIETELDDEELEVVAGGATGDTCAYTCRTRHTQCEGQDSCNCPATNWPEC